MADPVRDRLRAICLALPEAVEQEAWGDPTWRVRGRIFAMEKRGDGRVSVWLQGAGRARRRSCRRRPGPLLRAALRRAARLDRHRLVGPPTGPRSRAHVRTSYRLIAPKRLAARVAAP